MSDHIVRVGNVVVYTSYFKRSLMSNGQSDLPGLAKTQKEKDAEKQTLMNAVGTVASLPHKMGDLLQIVGTLSERERATLLNDTRLVASKVRRLLDSLNAF